MISVSVRYLFYQLMDEKFKENPHSYGEGIVQLANSVLQCDVKATL